MDYSNKNKPMKKQEMGLLPNGQRDCIKEKGPRKLFGHESLIKGTKQH